MLDTVHTELMTAHSRDKMTLMHARRKNIAVTLSQLTAANETAHRLLGRDGVAVVVNQKTVLGQLDVALQSAKQMTDARVNIGGTVDVLLPASVEEVLQKHGSVGAPPAPVFLEHKETQDSV